MNTAMKKSKRSADNEWELPTEEDVEIVGILFRLRASGSRSKLISGYSLTWGMKKKRSVLEYSISEPFAQQEKKSPSTLLCFVPSSGSGSDSGSGSGSDGCDKGKAPMDGPNVSNRKETDELMEACNRMQQEKDILMKQLKCMETHHQELSYEALEPKAKGLKINYPSNMEDYHTWDSYMKASDQQRCHQQIPMFAPATQQLMVDPTQVASCSGNSNGDGRFELLNQIDPRVKTTVETYDFMGISQPLDQSKHLEKDNDLRVMTAAAARKRRRLLMKEKKKLSLAMKLSR